MAERYLHYSNFAWEMRTKGRAEGNAATLLRVLKARGIEVPEETRRDIERYTDAETLEIWAERAATADTIDEVID